jgi:hypothetical protein
MGDKARSRDKPLSILVRPDMRRIVPVNAATVAES